MLKNRGLRFKLTLGILTCVISIFLIVSITNYIFYHDLILLKTKENAKNLSYSLLYDIDRLFVQVQSVPESIASVIENTKISEEDLINTVKDIVRRNKNIFGIAVAFEPHTFIPSKYFYSPYVFRLNNNQLKFIQMGSNKYNYFHKDWYVISKTTRNAHWTEPYFDDGGGDVIMSTYSVPFYKMIKGKKVFWGIVTADISIDGLTKQISQVKVLKTGYAFVLSKKGIIISHPEKKLVMNETIFSIAEKFKNKTLQKLGLDMIHGKEGFGAHNNLSNNKLGHIYFSPFPSNGWSLSVFYPEDELFLDITNISYITTALIILGLILITVFVLIISRKITQPIVELTAVAGSMVTKGLDITIPIAKSRDEVGKLIESFAYMRDSLQQYVKDLAETTAAREHIESELKIARDIQMSMLPRVFPPFPNLPNLDLHAMIKPAREVGGDLYDFFPIDDNRFCFVVGDVSGKGVPASFFMAITKTLVKIMATNKPDPAHILNRVNNELNIGNESMMFVTLFCGIIDLTTAEIQYANGGHNCPLLIHSDKGLDYLKRASGPALGVMKDVVYKNEIVTLKEDDILYLYTDGVTEAMDLDDQQYKEKRMEECLKRNRNLETKEILNSVLKDIQVFAKNNEQSDDITMMVIRLKQG